MLGCRRVLVSTRLPVTRPTVCLPLKTESWLVLLSLKRRRAEPSCNASGSHGRMRGHSLSIFLDELQCLQTVGHDVQAVTRIHTLGLIWSCHTYGSFSPLTLRFDSMQASTQDVMSVHVEVLWTPSLGAPHRLQVMLCSYVRRAQTLQLLGSLFTACLQVQSVCSPQVLYCYFVVPRSLFAACLQLSCVARRYFTATLWYRAACLQLLFSAHKYFTTTFQLVCTCMRMHGS